MLTSPNQRDRTGSAETPEITSRWSVIGVVGTLVATLIVLTGLTAVAAVVSRLQVERSTDRLQIRWAPAHVAAGAVRQGYSDQAAGQLRFLLTGENNHLRRYRTGQVDAARAQAQLQRLLPDDPSLPALLVALDREAQRWRTESVADQIAARRQGPIQTNQLVDEIGVSTLLYEAVRARLRAIDTHTHALETAELGRIADEQRRANIITVIAVGLAVLVAVLGVLLLRRALGRPSRTLLREVNTVAAGDYGHPVTRGGPLEFVAIADAVHRMRVSILDYGEQLADARQELTRAEEQERVGAELHDRTLRRLFGLGLTLTSTASRYPDLAPSLQPLIDETDDMVRELRHVIVGLPHDEPPGADASP